MEKNEIKELLDEFVDRINVPEFVSNDPVQFPKRYDNLQDIEVAGLLTALISWGKRSMILRNVDNMLSSMGSSPFGFIMESTLETNSIPYTLHRTFNSNDFIYLCKGLRHIYNRYSSLEQFFEGRDPFDGISSLREQIILGNNEPGNRAEKHLSSPMKNSACKRFHMYLRWMVRQDGIVDIGCWKKVSPAALYIPLDTHVANISRLLGMVDRKQNDRKTVESLTSVLREFDPSDPIRYDFALFGIGEAGLLK
ncbi:MAG: TIGR02757 family protein [Bacteroidales bacterium]